MLKIVLVGAGGHSQSQHLPSLAQYVSENPGQISLAGLCDLRRDLAETMAARYGFARVYTDLAEMLRQEKPDGCIAVTPIPVTAEIALQIIRAGVPLHMEKPPGASVEEARAVVRLAESTAAQVMVSMNRRFDPALHRALDWWGGEDIEYLRSSIIRNKRRDPNFITGTAIHPLDAMRHIAGDVCDLASDVRVVDDARWYVVRLRFQSGALGVLEVLPTAGAQSESYEILGANRRAFVKEGSHDSGEVWCWEDGRLVVQEAPAKGMPSFVRSGAYYETVEFISAIKEGRPAYPSPSQVLQSLELCHRIAGEMRSCRRSDAT